MRVASLASSTEWSLRIKPVYIKEECVGGEGGEIGVRFSAQLDAVYGAYEWEVLAARASSDLDCCASRARCADRALERSPYTRWSEDED